MVKITHGENPDADKFSCSAAKPTATGTLGADERPTPPPVTADPAVAESGLIDLRQPVHRRPMWSNQDQHVTLLTHSAGSGGNQGQERKSMKQFVWPNVL